MSNVIEFKSVKQLTLEALNGITIMDLFLILMEERGYDNIVVMGENAIGDVDILAENIEAVDDMIELYRFSEVKADDKLLESLCDS